MADLPLPSPQRPTQMPPYAEECLLALAAQNLGDKISLGGAFGLAHYFEYRTTHDVDAWWIEPATTADQRQVVAVIAQTLRRYGDVRERVWGDVTSVELLQSNRVVFSFQIARRSVQLEPTVSTPWVNAQLDSFTDLVASKMTALVERGAPRDFRDIYTLCQAGRTTPAECWHLWRERQSLSGSDASASRARLAVETHLARIAKHRPLERIGEPSERIAAQELRHWFEKDFLDVLVD